MKIAEFPRRRSCLLRVQILHRVLEAYFFHILFIFQLTCCSRTTGKYIMHYIISYTTYGRHILASVLFLFNFFFAMVWKFFFPLSNNKDHWKSRWEIEKIVFSWTWMSYFSLILHFILQLNCKMRQFMPSSVHGFEIAVLIIPFKDSNFILNI